VNLLTAKLAGKLELRLVHQPTAVRHNHPELVQRKLTLETITGPARIHDVVGLIAAVPASRLEMVFCFDTTRQHPVAVEASEDTVSTHARTLTPYSTVFP
jgi:hypothetical protein